MESLYPILVILALGIPVGACLGLVAFARTMRLRTELDLLRKQFAEVVREQARVRPAVPAPVTVPAPSPLPVSAAAAPIAVPLPHPELSPVPTPISAAPAVQRPVIQNPVANHAPQPGAGAAHESAVAAASSTFEALLGRNLLAWAGVGLLFLCMAFFAKYAYDQAWFGQLIGPRLRVVLVACAGLGLAAWGWRCVRQQMAALGQSAVGGGLAILQIAVYAAVMPALALVPEPLIGRGVAFALLVAITAAGVLCARRLDAVAISLIALIGGLLAPVLLGDGGNGRDLLFCWLLVLDLGVLAVAIEKRWRALDVVAALGTGGLAWGWFGQHYSPDQLLPTLAWFAVFHAVFLAVPLIFHVRTRTPVSVERVTLLLGNLAWFLSITGELAASAGSTLLIGIESAVLAPLYLVIGLTLKRRIPEDRLILPACLTLAIGLLTMALGNLLPMDGVAAAWVIESALLLHLGYHYRHPLTRVAGLLLTGLVLVRLFGHLPAVEGHVAPFANLRFLHLSLGALALGAQAFLHRRNGFRALAFDRLAAQGCGLAAVAWVMISGQGELLDEPLVSSALWWLLGGSVILASGRWLGGWPAQAMPWCAALCGVIAGGATLIAYGIESHEPLAGWVILNLRWIVGAGVVALLWQTRVAAVQPLTWIVAFLLWTLEGPAWCHQWLTDPAEAHRAASIALTAAWMLAAALLLTVGLLRQRRTLRVMALVLCALVAGKLLLIDLAEADKLLRILAFGMVGVLFLAGSWAYHRLLKPGAAG